MSWFSALVLYAVIWFLTLFVILPLRLVTQGDAGTVVPGTPQGAPVEAQMKRRLVITTGVASVVWVLVTAIILSGVITVEHMDALYRR